MGRGAPSAGVMSCTPKNTGCPTSGIHVTPSESAGGLEQAPPRRGETVLQAGSSASAGARVNVATSLRRVGSKVCGIGLHSPVRQSERGLVHASDQRLLDDWRSVSDFGVSRIRDSASVINYECVGTFTGTQDGRVVPTQVWVMWEGQGHC